MLKGMESGSMFGRLWIEDVEGRAYNKDQELSEVTHKK